jgi:hypothetical protein
MMIDGVNERHVGERREMGDMRSIAVMNQCAYSIAVINPWDS